MGLYLTILVQVVAVMVLTAVAGLVTCWIDRKVTARVQMRVGPPLLQPFYDIGKLMIKETCVPVGAPRQVFLLAPVLGLAGVTAASLILCHNVCRPGSAFVGDLIVLLYLLALPAIAVIIGAFASRNPLASVGGSREMKLMMSYEVPLILSLIVPIMKAKSIQLASVSAASSVPDVSGIIAVVVALVCVQAKLTQVPFDCPEAETELAGGAYIEYSGPPLGIYKLTRAMMMFTMPLFLIVVFLGGANIRQPMSMLYGVLKYVVIVVLIVLIRNTAPRVRIDQATRFFWGPMTVAALLAVVLAASGM